MTNIRASKHHTSYFWLVSCVVVGRLGLGIGPLAVMGIYKFTRIYKEEYPAIGTPSGAEVSPYIPEHARSTHKYQNIYLYNFVRGSTQSQRQARVFFMTTFIER